MQGNKLPAAQVCFVARPFVATRPCKLQRKRQLVYVSGEGNGAVEQTHSIKGGQEGARAWIAAWRAGSASGLSELSDQAVVEKASNPEQPKKLHSQQGGGTYQPQESFEDGSVLFTSASLLAVDFEELLAP